LMEKEVRERFSRDEPESRGDSAVVGEEDWDGARGKRENIQNTKTSRRFTAKEHLCISITNNAGNKIIGNLKNSLKMGVCCCSKKLTKTRTLKEQLTRHWGRKT